MRTIFKNESAVSPVVGVMMMLVVTIVIAAVVSGFAGGLVDSDSSSPQATVQGSYSYSSDVFQLYHAGGDELSTQKIIIKIQQKDEDFGGYGSLFSQKGTIGVGMTIANKSCVCTNLTGGECWLDSSNGVYNIAVFRPGDTMYYTDSGIQSGLSGYTDEDGNTDVVGRALILEVTTTSGQLISKSDVIIEP